MESSVAFEIYKNSRPWSFGTHAMLSVDDLNFVQAMLQCRWCCLRLIYHRLARQELAGPTECVKAGKSSGAGKWSVAGKSSSGTLRHTHHLHTLTRLIKAISSEQEARKACRNQKPRRRVCRIHAADVLQYMLYAADDDIYHLHIRGVASSRPAKWVGEIFVKGQSQLYRMLGGDSEVKKDDDSSDFGHFDWISPKVVSKVVIEANRRWNDYYGGDMNRGAVQSHVAKTNKRVRFPNGSPVTGVFNLVVYAVKNRCIRRDHTWIDAAKERLRREKRLRLEVERRDSSSSSSSSSEDGAIDSGRD